MLSWMFCMTSDGAQEEKEEPLPHEINIPVCRSVHGRASMVEPPLLSHVPSPPVSWHCSQIQCSPLLLIVCTCFPLTSHLCLSQVGLRHFENIQPQIYKIPPAKAVLASTMFSFSSDVSHWKVFYLLLTHTQRLSTLHSQKGWISWLAWRVARSLGVSSEVFGCRVSMGLSKWYGFAVNVGHTRN